MTMELPRACTVVPCLCFCLAGCPEGGGEDSQTGETTGTGDGDGDGDGDGEPSCPPSLPDEYVPGQFDIVALPSFAPSEDNFDDLQALCDPAEVDFGWEGQAIQWETVNGNGVDLLVYRPADPGGEWPVGQFPVVFHHHGNGGQDGALYEHVANAVVDDGAIFVSVGDARAATPDLRAMIDICMLRWLFTANDWDGDGPGTGGASKLDGNVIVMGHSNGGEGAHIVNNWFEERPWEDDFDAPEHDMRLCGVIGIAPRGAEAAEAPFSSGIGIAGPATVPYLTIEGSVDNDVPGGSLWNSSYSGLDELHGPTDAAKISVWVYDAEHDSFGGGGEIRPTDARSIALGEPVQMQHDRGQFVVSTWTNAFVRRFLFDDGVVEPVLYGLEPPMGLDVASWWDFHPASDGEPLLFVGSEPHQSSAAGELGVREVVDTMLRGGDLTCVETLIPDGASTTSEGTPFTAENWPTGTLRSDCALNLAAFASANRGRYETFVLRADYTAAPDDMADPAERTLTWIVADLDLRDAAAFSFRASNIDDVDYPGAQMGCSPVDGDPTDEADFDIVFVSVDDMEVTVSVSDYARLLAPDIFEVLSPQGAGYHCPASHFLQTVRIPLGEVLCAAFGPEDLREVRFVFDRLSAPEGRAELLDTVEFHRDLSGAPICG